MNNNTVLSKKKVPKKKRTRKKKKKKDFTSVVLRFRPKMRGEKEVIESLPMKPTDSKSIQFAAKVSGRMRKYTYRGYNKIFTQGDKNSDVFNFCCSNQINSKTFGTYCIFGYGHSGSGKTHTIFGYEKKEKGILYRSVESLIERLIKLNTYFINITAAEVHNNKIFDLLHKKKKKLCHLRDDGTGFMAIRSETMLNKKSSLLRIEGLKGRKCKTMADCKTVFDLIIKRRKVGSSFVHEESSRSHAMLCMEVISQKGLDLREERVVEESKLPPLQKMEMDIKKKSMKYYKPNGKVWRYWDVCKAIKALKKKLILLKREEEKYHKNQKKKNSLHGDRLVFIDLCGADYETATQKLSKENKKEAIEINKSLLALKECIESIAKRAPRAPWRHSKLTVLLKNYLSNENCKVLMMATASPCLNQLNGTTNTLKYSQLFAKSK